MKEDIEKMVALCDQIKENLTLYMKKGNKSAGRRARTESVEFEKLAKKFRKDSIESDKKA